FQLFIREERLPIESSSWSHNGGDISYPTKVTVIDNLEDGWQEISNIHQQGLSFNLLYRPSHIYIIPRKRQGAEGHAHWNSGITWYELCGEFVCFNREAFASLTAEDIRTEIAKVALG
ncbi:MAG: hypothetical protein OQK13_00195, partial [Gammaproteobacteria bacterium]|nr:hypothetical protein [Gammaproteobacteria bacterium]